MNVCFMDFETTGLDPAKGAEPIELAAVILNDQYEEINRFPARQMRVKHPENISPKALEVNGRTIESIMAGEEPRRVLADFLWWLGTKVVPAGHNVDFDMRFMKWMIETYASSVKWEDVFDYHTIDTAGLAYVHLVRTGKLDTVKLEAVAGYFGIPIDAHTAMGDVEAGIEVLRRFAQLGDFPEVRKIDTNGVDWADVQRIVVHARAFHAEMIAAMCAEDKGNWHHSNLDVLNGHMQACATAANYCAAKDEYTLAIKNCVNTANYALMLADLLDHQNRAAHK